MWCVSMRVGVFLTARCCHIYGLSDWKTIAPGSYRVVFSTQYPL